MMVTNKGDDARENSRIKTHVVSAARRTFEFEFEMNEDGNWNACGKTRVAV